MSLFHLMRRLGSLSPDAVVYYLFEMAKALNQLHNLGLTHGDVKRECLNYNHSLEIMSELFKIQVLIFLRLSCYLLLLLSVPNCVLMNDCRQLKFIDFDTLKKEDEFDQSGTPGYHAPEMVIL